MLHLASATVLHDVLQVQRRQKGSLNLDLFFLPFMPVSQTWPSLDAVSPTDQYMQMTGSQRQPSLSESEKLVHIAGGAAAVESTSSLPS